VISKYSNLPASVTGYVDLSLKSAADNLTRVFDLKIDAQQDLDFLQRFEALQGLTVCLSERLREDDFDTLPHLPQLSRLQILFDEEFHPLDTAVRSHHDELVDLSLLEGLAKLELYGTVKKPSLWARSFAGSPGNIQQMIVENIQLAGLEWDSFYPQLSGLRSLTMTNVIAELRDSITLPALQSLEMDNSRLSDRMYPDFTCPRLSLFVYTSRKPMASLNGVIENMVHRFATTLESFFFRCSEWHYYETLTPLAVSTLCHCAQLRNFLFEGSICITSPDWCVLRKVHDKLDRAIFIRPAHQQSESEKVFCVRESPTARRSSY
jgi:hypothetical protein